MAVFLPYLIVQCVLFYPFYGFNIKRFILDITFIDPQYRNGWYLNYIFMWYIIFYVVKRFSALKKYSTFILGVISVILFFYMPEIRAEQSLSFFSGILFSEYENFENVKTKANWKTGLLMIFMGMFFLMLKQTSFVKEAPSLFYTFVQLLIKLPCGLGLCFIYFSVRKKIKFKIFGLLGVISYELYLIHGYVLNWVTVSLSGEIMFIMESLIMAIMLHYLLRVIDKPCRDFLKMNSISK